MNEPEFEWDAVKAAQNEADHGISFEMARDVFKDPVAIEWLDDRKDYGEDRYVIIGMVDNRLLYVAYAMRGEAIRTISTRGAEPHERRQYHEDNGGYVVEARLEQVRCDEQSATARRRHARCRCEAAYARRLQAHEAHAAGQVDPPRARPHAARICRTLSHSPRYAPRLGAGCCGSRSVRPRLSHSNCSRSRGRAQGACLCACLRSPPLC